MKRAVLTGACDLGATPPRQRSFVHAPNPTGPLRVRELNPIQLLERSCPTRLCAFGLRKWPDAMPDTAHEVARLEVNFKVREGLSLYFFCLLPTPHPSNGEGWGFEITKATKPLVLPLAVTNTKLVL